MQTPYQIFADVFKQATDAGIPEPSAMALATVGTDNRPSLRMVLLKGYDEQGFVFYTNLDSRKAQEIRAVPYAALCFFWQAIGKQVRIEGRVEQVSDAEADEYFATRPYGSQIGAWASSQSAPLEERGDLLARVRQAEERFEGKTVPRPPFWSGFRVIPDRIEFWTAGEFRLHDRQLFELDEIGGWKVTTLYP